MKRLITGAFLVLLLAGVALAGGKRGVVESSAVERNVATLNSQVVWHRSLDEAKAAAVADKKLILWVHLLGDMEGAT